MSPSETYLPNSVPNSVPDTLHTLSAQAGAALDGSIHLWELSAPAGADSSADLLRMLTGPERTRAARIIHAPSRCEFVAGRAFLRQLLGAALGLQPLEVPLVPSASGKPQTPGMHYNLSHSEGLLLLGLCRDAAIGVDVEWTGRDVEALELAGAVFSVAEVAWLRTLDEGSPLQSGFFACWTRKEAILKCLGDGLGQDPRRVTVLRGTPAPGSLLPATCEDGIIGWTREVTVRAGYAAAVACCVEKPVILHPLR